MRNLFNFEAQPFSAYSEFDEDAKGFDLELTDTRQGEVSQGDRARVRWVQSSLNKMALRGFEWVKVHR